MEAGATLINDVERVAVAGRGGDGRRLGGHAHAGHAGRDAGRPALRRRRGRSAGLSGGAGRHRGRDAGVGRGVDRSRASDSARPSPTTWRCWPHLDEFCAGDVSGFGRFEQKVHARHAHSRARRHRSRRLRTASKPQSRAQFGRQQKALEWSGFTMWPLPWPQCALWGSRYRREGQVGGRDPAPEFHLGDQRSPRHQRTALVDTAAATAGFAAKKRWCGCAKTGSAASCRCWRRRTTWRRTKSSGFRPPTCPFGAHDDPREALPVIYKQLQALARSGRTAVGARRRGRRPAARHRRRLPAVDRHARKRAARPSP